jgi:hypothetical protein
LEVVGDASLNDVAFGPCKVHVAGVPSLAADDLETPCLQNM